MLNQIAKTDETPRTFPRRNNDPTKDWLVDKTFLVEIVERRHYVVLGNLLVTHAQDAIERHVGEAGSRLGNRLSEGLVRDGQAVDGHRIYGQIAGDTAGSVLDGEVLAAGHEGGGSTGVILVVLLAGHIRGQALGRWHPQVGRTRVKDHLEVLLRGANANQAVVVHVHRVAQLLGCVVNRGLAGIIVSVVGLHVNRYSIVVNDDYVLLVVLQLQSLDSLLAMLPGVLVILVLVDLDAVDLSTDQRQDGQQDQPLQHYDLMSTLSFSNERYSAALFIVWG